jgi:hypothetical protein
MDHRLAAFRHMLNRMSQSPSHVNQNQRIWDCSSYMYKHGVQKGLLPVLSTFEKRTNQTKRMVHRWLWKDNNCPKQLLSQLHLKHYYSKQATTHWSLPAVRPAVCILNGQPCRGNDKSDRASTRKHKSPLLMQAKGQGDELMNKTVKTVVDSMSPNIFRRVAVTCRTREGCLT